MRLVPRWLIVALSSFAISATETASQTPAAPLSLFFEAASTDERTGRAAQAELTKGWKPSYAALILDLVRFMRPPQQTASIDLTDASSAAGNPDGARRGGGTPTPDPGSPVRGRLFGFLDERMGRRIGDNLVEWRRLAWSLPDDPHPDYAEFKAAIYGRIDPRMAGFFPAKARATIRLDEIDWGGVTVNGIPPLRYPKALAADEAGYLGDGHIVFGVVVNGEARAYPKRILAWHEMAIDRLGGIELTIVYCTLCGTVIPYESVAGGRHYKLGTSGLLYRSNKLMFDEDSQSLWSTFEGVPVVGALVGSGVKLTSRPAVTTTWKEWRALHPKTSVLSLDTGHRRDYSEGAAYREYFATDRLMFEVPSKDARLKNKAEVLVMQLPSPDAASAIVPVALDTRLLRSRPVYSFTAAGAQYVVVTSPQGANRVYRTETAFPDQRPSDTIVDGSRQAWTVTEDALVPAGHAGTRAPRVSAQRAFWFGWHAQFPKTLLFK